MGKLHTLPLGLHPSHHKVRNRWAIDYDETLARALPAMAAAFIAKAFREYYDCRFGPNPLITSKQEQLELYRAQYRRRMDALETGRDAPALGYAHRTHDESDTADDALDPFAALLRD